MVAALRNAGINAFADGKYVIALDADESEVTILSARYNWRIDDFVTAFGL